MQTKNRHSSSFRDPSGYVFTNQGQVFRQVNPIYFEQYNSLKGSGFYEKLFKAGLLIPHEETESTQTGVTLKPENISFFSYPYEWSFNQYKHAALHTLKLLQYFLLNGYSLIDATAFNIMHQKVT